MKRIISTLLVCVLLIGCVFTFASCTLLMGKYETNLVAAEVSYEFGIFGTVTIEVDPIIGDDTEYKGKYTINDAGDKITIIIDDEKAELYDGEFSFAKGEENGKQYIKIAGVKYEKVDD